MAALLRGSPFFVLYYFSSFFVNSEKDLTFAKPEPQASLQCLNWRSFYSFIYKCTIMARLIKETPVLTGKDAERFVKRMNEKRIVSDKEIERVKKNYEYILSIAKF